MKIVFASLNAGKLKEIQNALLNMHLDIIPQAELCVKEVAETGLTFVENALIKARHACLQTGLPALAEDSGLIVPVLNDIPGIYSARYAGEKATSEDNIKKLLQALIDIPNENRHAYFYCALVYLPSALNPTPIICHGTWHGRILRQPQGKNGFGYDSVFFDPEQNLSAAELSTSMKNKISHRGQALQSLSTSLSIFKAGIHS